LEPSWIDDPGRLSDSMNKEGYGVMKNAIIGMLALPAVAILAAAPAAAQQSGFYARGDIGGSFSTSTGGNILNGDGFGNDFGSSVTFSGGVGMYVPTPGWPFQLRVDLTGGYRPDLGGTHTGSAGGFTLTGHTNLDTATVLANIYADIPTGTAFTPYVGFGIGAAINSLDTIKYDFNGVPSATEAGTTQTNFAWTVGLGVSYAMSSNLLLDVGYHYLDAGDVKSSGVVQVFGRPAASATQTPLKSDLSTHEVTIGLRYNF
jgi:opacity protein-like surface antigen